MTTYDINEFDKWFDKLIEMVRRKSYQVNSYTIEIYLSKVLKEMEQVKVDIYKELLEHGR